MENCDSMKLVDQVIDVVKIEWLFTMVSIGMYVQINADIEDIFNIKWPGPK